MGEGREDTDPRQKRPGTQPGLGAPGASGHAPAAATVEDGPEAVDFDALHAALGDPLELDELPLAATEINGDDDLIDSFEPAEQRVGESSGATNAAYASARPHTIPPSYTPVSDLNAPPVIVASEDTVPSAPPNMTVPVGHAHAIGHTPQSGMPFIAGAPPASSPVGGGRAPSGPQHVGAPISGPHPSAGPGVGYPAAPHAAPARAVAQMTMRMPERPLNPRRGKTPTIVVRPRGPSAKQKLIAFMAMLLLVTACGIAVIIWRKPRWLGLDPTVPLTPPSAASTESSGAAPPMTSTAASTAASAPASPPHPAISASAAVVASASASAPAVVPRPKPRPPASAPPRQ